MITAITPTGDRLLAFSLCCRWLGAQTMRPYQWIVVDDGKIKISSTAEFWDDIPETNLVNYVRREPKASDPKYTLSENLRMAIPLIKGDKILIIEDDEYYAPGYVEAVAKHLDKAEVTGIGRSRYYHLPTGGNMVIGNMGHASLAQTGFRKSFVPELMKILKPGKLYIDYAVWQAAKRRRSAAVFQDKSPLYVGMKGMPGRAGIGRGHDPQIYKRKDPGRTILKRWIPKDYQVYLDILMDGK